MITTAEIAVRVEDDRLPLLTLDEFFCGNGDEQSLAPNRLGFRPALAGLAGRLRTLDERDDVAWVRVSLHDEMALDDADGRVIAESVLVATTLPAGDLRAVVELAWLGDDGILESDETSLEEYVDVPPVSGDHRIVFLVWE